MKRVLTIGGILFLLVILIGCTQYEVAEIEPDVVAPQTEEPLLFEQEGWDCYIPDVSEEYAAHEYISVTGEERFSIEFPSLENFLKAYLIVSAGEDARQIRDLTSERWLREMDFTHSFLISADRVDLAALETIYLPVNIPEEFGLYEVVVREHVLSFRFLHPDDIVFIEENAEIRDVRGDVDAFTFSFPRELDTINSIVNFSWEPSTITSTERLLQSRNSALQRRFDMPEQCNLTEEDLIHGKYLFSRGGSVQWVWDNRRFSLVIPESHHLMENRERRGVFGGLLPIRSREIPLAEQLEIVGFTEMVALDLRDTRAVETMIAELATR